MTVQVKIWDVPTRLFHWTLVGLFGVMWYTGEQGGEAKTVSPLVLVSGLLSPVNAAVLNDAVSDNNSPSNPNFSPGFN